MAFVNELNQINLGLRWSFGFLYQARGPPGRAA